MHGGVEDDSSRRPEETSSRAREKEPDGSRAPRVVETAMPKHFRARIYACRRGRICQVPKNAKLVVKLLDAIFSCFAKNFRMPISFSKLLEILKKHGVERVVVRVYLAIQ